MTAVRPREADGFIARPNPAQPIILLYGPDAGLVRERADALMASAVDDTSDPFSVVRMDGDELAAAPSRLVEEAMTVPLFGGRRAIRVRAGSKSFVSAIEVLTETSLHDCRIVIEAGELRADAPLRKVCERAKTAAAIACYADGERDIARLIDDELRAAGLKIAPDARGVLASLLGGDRQASRNEVRKLALYAHGSGEVTLEHVADIVTDASSLALDAVIDGAFSGRPADVEKAYAKAIAAGTYPGMLVMNAQRHAASLHRAKLTMDAEGQNETDAASRGFPRLHFSRQSAVETALRNLSAARLGQFMLQLGDAARDMRLRTDLAEIIAQRALLAVAANARRRGSDTSL